MGRLVEANFEGAVLARSDVPSPNKVSDLIRACYQHAVEFSEDRSNQTAALILAGEKVVAIASNCIPCGVQRLEARISERPTKYDFIEHSERRAIYKAAKAGVALEGLTMVTPWCACVDCARAIIISGINRVISHKQRCELTDVGRDLVGDMVPNRWGRSTSVGDAMLDEAGIERIYFDGEIGETFLVNGQLTTL